MPGAALGAIGSPAGADRNGSVPAPREPSQNPSVGSARPVTASASVPSANRPVEATELPPPSAAPQARVYGRPAPAEPVEEEAPEVPDEHDAFGARPDSAFGDQPGSPFGDHPDSPFGMRPDSPFGSRPGGEDRPATPPGGFGSPAYGERSNDPNAPGSEPGVAPQSPARATARASASARVSPPTSGGPANPPTGMSSAPALPGAAPEPAAPGSPYADRPGPGGPGGRPGEPYSELTTDIAGRERQPYVPAPALPPMPPGLNGFDPANQPRSNSFGPAGQSPHSAFAPPGSQPHNGFGPPGQQPGGFGQQPPAGFGPGPDGQFANPASRATVTPPTPEDTTSWPGVEADQGRFDNFKAEEKPAPAKAETPHVRLMPILLAVVVAAILLLGAIFGIVYLVAGGSDKSLSVIQGECVKRDGESAVKSECTESGSFQVSSIVDDKAQCADPGQPYVINKTTDGKSQVLCLKANA